MRTLRQMAAARVLRAELLAMASHVARHPSRTGAVRLVHPRISEQRLEEEWRAAAHALRPSVLSRLSLQVVFPSGRFRVFGEPRGLAPVVASRRVDADASSLNLPPRDLSFAVEKLLVWAWLRLQRGWLLQSQLLTAEVFWYFVVGLWPVIYGVVYL